MAASSSSSYLTPLSCHHPFSSSAAMGVMTGRYSSNLNPNAPMFVPWAYRAVEDYSAEWWQLVQTSPWFCDYWLQECFQEVVDPQTDPDFDDLDDSVFLPDIDALFDVYQQEEEEDKGGIKDLVSIGAGKWQRTRALEPRKYMEKVPKIVNVKLSPRPIQQPR